ncbi:unnamed protein product, partial [Cyprideis torosa]
SLETVSRGASDARSCPGEPVMPDRVWGNQCCQDGILTAQRKYSTANKSTTGEKEDVSMMSWTMKMTNISPSLAQDIVLKPRVLQQLEKTTHFFFTSALEAYHSEILKYSSKRIHFPYSGMRARSQMSILVHNLNLGRKQAVNKKTGELRFNRKWSKKTKQWIVTPVLEPKKYDFRKKICTMVMEEAACTDRLVDWIPLKSLTLATSRQQAWYVGSSIPHLPHLQTLGGKRVAGSSEEVPRVSRDV